jgi:hypothetical protein
MVQMQGGVFGAVSDSESLVAAVAKFCPESKVPLPAAVPAAAANGISADQSPAPGKVVQVVGAKPYVYALPLAKTALVMIDFQKDFMLEGGFGATLGNDVLLLQVCSSCKCCAVMLLTSPCRRLIAGVATAMGLILPGVACQPDTGVPRCGSLSLP